MGSSVSGGGNAREKKGTYGHDAFKGSRLTACGPAEAFEAVVAPQVVDEEDLEL